MCCTRLGATTHSLNIIDFYVLHIYILCHKKDRYDALCIQYTEILFDRTNSDTRLNTIIRHV